MTDLQIFAFIVLPAIVVAIGSGAALLHVYLAGADERRHRRSHEG